MSRDSVDMQISRVISCIRCPSMTFPQSAALLVCSSLYHSALCLSGGSAEKCLYFSFATSMSKQNSFFPAAISEKMVSLGIMPYTILVFIASDHISFRITTSTLSPLTQISIAVILSKVFSRSALSAEKSVCSAMEAAVISRYARIYCRSSFSL